VNGDAQEAEAGSAKTILVVDDEEPIRSLLCAALSRRGYRCLLAAGDQEAMQHFSEASGAVDLLIADMIMPGMHGLDLASRLAKLRTGLQVLIISGFGHGVRLDPAWRFLAKPFHVRELLEVVESMLHRPPAGGRNGGGRTA
jgi:DNA-binding NtrC family response regulator